MKTFKIAGIEIKNPFVLAPLAGYTDYAMRQMSADKGAGLVYSEMESCEALLYHSKPTIKDLTDTALDKKYRPETKLALQIFGGKKEVILNSVPLFEKYADYDFLDFNCGCPVPKVIKQHAGSDWLNRPDELIDLMRDLVKVSSKPVVIKMRIGFDTIIDMPHLCKQLEDVGVQAIAVHGRKRSEFFSGPIHLDVIKAIKDAVSIPVMANGSITSANYKEVIKATGCDAIMIGQGALGYPKIFEDLIRLENGLVPRETTLESQIKDLKEHLRLIYSFKEERPASDIMRSYSVKYIKGFNNSKEKRQALVHANSLKEYIDILDSMQNEQ